jgi:2-phospho-L-lactate guanylyltransferase
MRPWLVLPFKSIEHGKSRLASHLSASARSELNRELLARSLALAARYPGIERTLVVSRCAEVLALSRAHGAHTLHEAGRGLNRAVAQAAATLKDSAVPTLVMSCDLPHAHEDDLRALVRGDEVALATDRRGSGTNALCLPPGAAFAFHFGAASRQRHTEEARRRGWRCRVLLHSSLAFDLDTLEDLREWQGQPPLDVPAVEQRFAA